MLSSNGCAVVMEMNVDSFIRALGIQWLYYIQH